jgi:hypothetical protein
MEAVRLNLLLPKKLAREIETLAGPRKKNRFIIDALQQKVEEVRRSRLEESLREGYSDRREEDLEVAKEFEAVDLEGWGDY